MTDSSCTTAGVSNQERKIISKQ
ncbi:hypothetical protein ID866_8605 [Astraeus odoratus]|nr:hypothetical protein ID866_8605 [Astraeus odoratus]